MKLLLIFVIILFLIAISLLHFYWVAGGEWGIEGAMPAKFRNDYFNPANRLSMTLATLVVAIGLLLFAATIASNYFDWSLLIPKKYTLIGTRIIGAIFLVRAIGDFNRLGLFKKTSNDIFAKKDSKIYVPLCLFLGIGSLVVSFLG